MFELDSNQTLLLSCLMLLIGVGTYLTYFRQQNTLQSLNQKIEQKREERNQIRTLQANLADAEKRLKEARRRWRTQYKIVPETISSADVISYLNELTQTGFKTFNVSASEPEEREGYSVRAFTAEGKAFFTNLYRFVWTVENNRPFYRVRDLQLTYLEERETNEKTGRTSMDVLVSFEMEIEAIYGAVKNIPPPSGREVERLPVAQTAPSPPLPSSVLPNPAPEVNPFYPLVFENIPPNEYGRLNVESAQLLSIVGGQAIFRTGDGIERVREGDRVYLGRIVEVNPNKSRVVARLNKGGIVERVELSVGADRPSKQTGEETPTEGGSQE